MEKFELNYESPEVFMTNIECEQAVFAISGEDVEETGPGIWDDILF